MSRILYQSEACLVANKLKGEDVEASPRPGITSLPQLLVSERLCLASPSMPLPAAVHRLDVPVTGCVLFALTKPALTFLGKAFAGGVATPVKKIYLAVLEKPSFPLPANSRQWVQLVHWIETNRSKNKSFAHNEEGGQRKKARMQYRITGEGKNYLFAEIELFTGRHHQIRAQLAAAGLHVKGDLKYGSKRSEKGGGIRLHAYSLSFPDPLNKSELITVTAEPPEMDNLWKECLLV